MTGIFLYYRKLIFGGAMRSTRRCMIDGLATHLQSHREDTLKKVLQIEGLSGK